MRVMEILKGLDPTRLVESYQAISKDVIYNISRINLIHISSFLSK